MTNRPMQPFIKKFQNYWYQSAFFTIMQRFSNVFLGMVSYIILVRVLTKEEVGTWALFLAITTTFEQTKSALLKNGLITISNSTNDKQEKSSIASSSLIINSVFTIFFLIIVFAFAKNLSQYWKVPDLKYMLYLYSITAIAYIPFSHYDYIQQTNLSFKGVFASYFSRQAIFFILVAAGLIEFKSILTLNNLVLCQSIGTLISAIIAFLYVRKFLTFNFKPSRRWTKVLIGYGKFAFGSGACSNIFGSMDRYMTASLLNSVDVAYYDVCSKFNNLIDVPTNAAADMIFPKSARASFEEGKDKVRYMYERMVGILAGLVLPVSIFIFIFAEWAIKIIAGPKYIAAASIVRIAMLYVVLRPVQIQGSNILNSINKPNITFYLNLVILFFNLIFNYVCIRLFGMLGAAYGTLLSTVFSFSITFYFLHKIIGARLSGLIKYTFDFYKSIFNNILKLQKVYAGKKSK